jgi:lipopolysaccharide transport system permease protein
MRDFARYLGRVWDYRFFWLSLVRSDLRQRYRRSVLGILWSVLHPLAMTAIVCVVYKQLFKAETREFVPYLITGLAFWNWFSANVLQGSMSLYTGEPYLRQEPVPSAIFSLRATLSVGFHFLILLLVAIVVSWSLRGPCGLWPLLSLLPVLAILFVLGWALATLVGFLNVYFPDTHHLSEVGLQLLFYSTPIIYPLSVMEGRTIGNILEYNPLYILVELVRTPVLSGDVPSAAHFGMAASFAFVAALLAIIVVRRYEHRLVYQL